MAKPQETEEAKELNVRGINKEKIPTIKEKFEDYYNKIKTLMEKDVATFDSDLNKAIKGDNSLVSFKAEYATIVNECTTALANLDKFKTALDKLETAYATQDQASTFKVEE